MRNRLPSHPGTWVRESLGTSGIPPAIGRRSDCPNHPRPGGPAWGPARAPPSPARRNRALCERRKLQRKGKRSDGWVETCEIHQPHSDDTDVNTLRTWKHTWSVRERFSECFSNKETKIHQDHNLRKRDPSHLRSSQSGGS